MTADCGPQLGPRCDHHPTAVCSYCYDYLTNRYRDPDREALRSKIVEPEWYKKLDTV